MPLQNLEYILLQSVINTNDGLIKIFLLNLRFFFVN